MSNQLTLPTTVADMVPEYQDKDAEITARIEAVNEAVNALRLGATVQGVYADRPFEEPRIDERTVRKNLLKSGWKAIYQRLEIERIASAKDQAEFARHLESPPELTIENAVATFRDYFENTRFHILRGLAEAFVDLDPAYKSHSRVKVGKDKLPKRIILSNVGGYGSYGMTRLENVLNAVASVRGQPLLSRAELNFMHAESRACRSFSFDGREVPAYTRELKNTTEPLQYRDCEIRFFQNGNAHVHFGKIALTDINRGLAEFYGDVLPDAEDDDAPTAKRASTDVAKDLQYYPSPAAVITEALDRAGIYKPDPYRPDAHTAKRVLEPSCGDGRILDEIAKRGHVGFGYEIHAERARQARQKNHAVQVANFLEVPPSPEFDVVVMNPPFYGRHYAKHVRHAYRFLKPGGVLVAILPATAEYDHNELDDLKSDQPRYRGETWRDLPVGSFAESGTNVPTGILQLFKPEQASAAAA
jgi:hypothetical protein